MTIILEVFKIYCYYICSVNSADILREFGWKIVLQLQSTNVLNTSIALSYFRRNYNIQRTAGQVPIIEHIQLDVNQIRFATNGYNDQSYTDMLCALPAAQDQNADRRASKHQNHHASTSPHLSNHIPRKQSAIPASHNKCWAGDAMAHPPVSRAPPTYESIRPSAVRNTRPGRAPRPLGCRRRQFLSLLCSAGRKGK